VRKHLIRERESVCSIVIFGFLFFSFLTYQSAKALAYVFSLYLRESHHLSLFYHHKVSSSPKEKGCIMMRTF